MIDYIISNTYLIGGALITLILFFYALFTRQWSLLQVAAYKLMLDAERIMSTKKGKAKMQAVYAAVWAQVPKWLKKFVTEKTLREKLQELYDKAKDTLFENRDQTYEK